MCCHSIRYGDVKSIVTYKAGHAKDALAKICEGDLSNRNFPLSPIRYTFTPKSSCNDLMTETYSCPRTVSNMLSEFDSLGHTNNLDMGPARGDVSYPRYELAYPFNILVCRCG